MLAVVAVAVLLAAVVGGTLADRFGHLRVVRATLWLYGLGPLIAGVSIGLAEPVLEETQGYAAVFGVVSAAILLSIPFVHRIDLDPAGKQAA